MDIFDIAMPDGTHVNSVHEAVAKFKCPGPCDPDCPLYPVVRISGESFGHMCHPEIVSRYPVSVLDAMRCSYSTRVGDQAAKTGRLYAAVVHSGAVRDVQVCRDSDCDPMSENWEDVPDAEMWLGLFRDPGALEEAAAFGRTVPENIRLIPVDEAPGKEASDGRRETP